MATFFQPYTYTADSDVGRPVFSGRLFFGRPNTDPVQPANQVNARLVNEDGSFTLLPQPVMTGAGGIPVAPNGSPALLDIDAAEYSVTVQDRNGRQRYYAPRVSIIENAGTISQIIEQFRFCGYPTFVTPAQNNDVPVQYKKYATVFYDPGTGIRLYESLVANNTALPTVTANWRIVDFEGNDARYAPVSAIAPGDISFQTTDTPRTGFFALDGSTITNARTDYPALFNSGSRFAVQSGDNLTLHNAADFFRGRGNSVRAVGAFEDDALQNITGSIDNAFTPINKGNPGPVAGAIGPSPTLSVGHFGGGNQTNIGFNI